MSATNQAILGCLGGHPPPGPGHDRANNKTCAYERRRQPAVDTIWVPVDRRDAHSLHGTHGEVLTAISDGMVALLKEYYGRGPDRTKSYYHDDLVVCLLRGGFTRVEQTLLSGGRGQAVLQQRMEFQEVMRERFAAVVEHATGRRVVGFMSGNQQSPDMICEVFVLAPTDLVGDELPTAG
jgi:uncharacterized protein YbcI